MRIACTLALSLALTGPAAAWPLVSPGEDRADRAAPHVIDPAREATRAPPSIVLVRPETTGPLRNPVSLELRFETTSGAGINMDSVRATYGWLGIDITRRLLAHATRTANTLSAENVNIPLGRHRVTISVADTAGRVGSRTFQISIVR